MHIHLLILVFSFVLKNVDVWKSWSWKFICVAQIVCVYVCARAVLMTAARNLNGTIFCCRNLIIFQISFQNGLILFAYKWKALQCIYYSHAQRMPYTSLNTSLSISIRMFRSRG